MNDVLDKPVPRELMDRLFREENINELDVRELHEDQVVGSLRQVLAPDVNRAILNVTDAGYRYQVVDQAEGPISVLYFRDLNEDAVDAITLHLRDVGVDEPPLSVNEHLKLGGLFGIDEETLRIFKEAVLLEMKYEGLIQSFGPTIVSIPALRCIRPTDFDESALDWARRNAKRYDFVINEVQHTGGEIEVSPVDPDGLEMLKRQLEDDNIIVEDVVQDGTADERFDFDEDELPDDEEDDESTEDEADSQVDDVLEAEYYPFGLRGYGRGVGGPRQRDGGVSTCICPKCGHEMPHLRGRACQTVNCPECGAPMTGESLHERVVGKFTHVDDRHHGRGYSEELFQRLLAVPVTEQHIPGDAPTHGQARIAILKSLRHQDVTVIVDQMEGIRDDTSHKDGLKVTYFIRRMMDGARIKGPYVAEFWKIGRKWELRTTPPDVEWTDYDVERKESMTEGWRSVVGFDVPRKRPTARHRPAMWEGMLGTINAYNGREVKYFDYDWKAAAEFAGVSETVDPRLYRYPARYSYPGMREGHRPKKNQLVLWIVKDASESVQEEPNEDEADDAIAQQIDQLLGVTEKEGESTYQQVLELMGSLDEYELTSLILSVNRGMDEDDLMELDADQLMDILASSVRNNPKALKTVADALGLGESITEEVKYYIVKKEDESVAEGPFDGPQQAHQRLGSRTDAEDLKVMPMGTDAPEEE